MVAFRGVLGYDVSWPDANAPFSGMVGLCCRWVARSANAMAWHGVQWLVVLVDGTVVVSSDAVLGVAGWLRGCRIVCCQIRGC